MNQYLPVQGSAHASQLDQLNSYVHILMLVLFVGWGLFFIYTLFRFSKGRNPKANYHGVQNHYSTYVEISVALIEVVLLVGLSIPLWAHRVAEFPKVDEALQINIVAEQFAWNVHYAGPDGIFGKRDAKLINSTNPVGVDRANDPAAKDDVITLNQLHLPLGKKVIINVTSKDVIHSFALQEMRVKQDAIPGQVTPLWFIPTKTTDQIREEYSYAVNPATGSVYPGYVAMADYGAQGAAPIVKAFEPVDVCALKNLAAASVQTIKVGPATPTEISCAQLCGIGHYRMKGFVTVESPEAFDKWLKEQAAAAATAGTGGYE